MQFRDKLFSEVGRLIDHKKSTSVSERTCAKDKEARRILNGKTGGCLGGRENIYPLPPLSACSLLLGYHHEGSGSNGLGVPEPPPVNPHHCHHHHSNGSCDLWGPPSRWATRREGRHKTNDKDRYRNIGNLIGCKEFDKIIFNQFGKGLIKKIPKGIGWKIFHQTIKSDLFWNFLIENFLPTFFGNWSNL